MIRQTLPIALAIAAATTTAATGASAQAPETGVRVAPEEFTETPKTLRKQGVTVTSAQLRPIVPGVTKDTVYTLIGVPHFGEGITRRWNHVVFVVDGEQTVRCRLQLDFWRSMRGAPITVRQITWNSQQCADLAAR